MRVFVLDNVRVCVNDLTFMCRTLAV